ncbi:HNH endonuclease [Mesorhizobium sp. BR115XR7A]|uniref:HNH endonuclease n=1 Tax=Mesorhizobium sp. BR115XR7A TaxID=2876645 RepID=UPI001CCD4B82|nr:HNH endonuclease [Mesorhizobium sp. BR115XR7A]MBZ9908073.1 HNH endonuclease [Mesorhizobium sp. BR115XR7A]MBZ9931383.1 HNH endonuclease [Mesorhizobium sp. BR1-1-5]
MTNKALTQEILLEILDYDPVTGELKNRINRGRAKAGFVHRTKNSNGYIVIHLKGKLCLAHHVIWKMETGEWPVDTIDHQDLDRTNNRWDNLREANQWQQKTNRKVFKNNRLGIKGVRQRGNRFGAHIRLNGKLLHLGHYDTAEEASEAYTEAANMAFRQFARSA